LSEATSKQTAATSKPTTAASKQTTATSKQTTATSKQTLSSAAATSKQTAATSKETTAAASKKTGVTPNVNVQRADKKNAVHKRDVKRKKPTKCCCLRIAWSDESLSDALTIERAAQITQAIYPGVNCGHKNCLQYPIMTPKNMGWLWSLRETGGVKVSLDCTQWRVL